MPTNDFLPFATGGGANVITQAEYAALTSLLANGFSAGTALSNQLNKVWRQSAFVSAALAEAIMDMTGVDILDDGVIQNFEDKFLLMLQQQLYAYAVAGGTADAITASFTPAIASLVSGLTVWVRAATANATTTPTFTPNNGVIAAKPIVKGGDVALAVGDVAGAGHWLMLKYDLTLDKWVLLNPATGIASLSGYALLNAAQSWTKGQRGAVVALTDGATITPDFALANNFSVTLGGNRILANPTNIGEGQSGIIAVTQDGVGSRTLAYGSYYKAVGGSAYLPVLSTAIGAVDHIAYYVETPTRIRLDLGKGVG